MSKLANIRFQRRTRAHPAVVVPLMIDGMKISEVDDSRCSVADLRPPSPPPGGELLPSRRPPRGSLGVSMATASIVSRTHVRSRSSLRPAADACDRVSAGSTR
jgi:hypothetical protein